MVMTRTTPILGAYLAREAKAMCIKEVITWLKERQLDTCIIETDSMHVIEALHTSS